MLVVGEPDDAGQPVRGAELVEEVVLLQAKDTLPAPCKMECRGGAHSAEADDDRVVPVHRRHQPTPGLTTMSTMIATTITARTIPTARLRALSAANSAVAAPPDS